MNVGVVAMIALNNMLFAFLIWALLRSAVVLAVALGLSSAFLLLRMPSRGFGCFCLLRPEAMRRRRAVVCAVSGRRGGGVAVASVKAYLAAGAVAGLLAGVLLALMVVATATPEAEAVPEVAREAGVSVEEARILYNALLFGAAVGVGFGMFISWLLAALLWRLLEPRINLPRPLPHHAEPPPSSSP